MSTPAVPPYSPIVRAGDWLIVSGQIGLVDGALVPGGIQAELRQAIANMTARCCSARRASLAAVRKTTVFLRHIRDYSLMNETYAELFPEPYPARSAFAVSELPFVRARRDRGLGVGRR